jgi:glycine rich protein
MNQQFQFPTTPTIGQRFEQWIWSGSSWVCAGPGGATNILVFLGSGTYMPSPNCQSLTVECIGGGGGAGAVAAATDTLSGGGGGGGGGGYSRKALPVALVRGGVLVTVGAGGTGFDVDTPAGTGGQTTFGALCVAFGGTGGEANNLMTVGGSGGPGAVIGVGDFVQPGNDGQMGDGFIGDSLAAGFSAYMHGGIGGAGPFGGQQQASAIGPGGLYVGHTPRPNTGAGGTAGVVHQFNGSVNAVPGASGICVVTEMIAGGGDGFVEDCGGGRARVERSWSPRFEFEEG